MIDGMARALWVHAFMIWSTEVESAPMMQGSWGEMAPDTESTRAASRKAAVALEELIAAANPGLGDRNQMSALFASLARGSGDAAAAEFGEEIALIAIGARSRDDSRFLRDARVRIPYFKVELDDDGRELSWDGGMSWNHGGGGGCECGGDEEEEEEDEDEDDLPQENPRRWSSSDVQSLLFDRKAFTPARAKQWAESHGFRFGKVDTTEWYHRLRQHDPVPGAQCRTISFSEGIRAVVCQRRNPEDGAIETLVVEDDKTLQRAYPRMIRKLYPEAEVFVVDNYDAAVGYLKAHPIGLVISDVDIVGSKNGIDVFEWVKSNQPSLVDKYVFVTGGNAHVEQLHYRYAEKPATLDDIREAIARPAPSSSAATAMPNPPRRLVARRIL